MSFRNHVILLTTALLFFVVNSYAGPYCGGAAPIDVYGYCRSVYGAEARAVVTRADAIGWVCRAPGQRDQRIDMTAVCKRSHGDLAMATLRGISASDWKCVLPSDFAATIVPVMLYPRDLVKPANVDFVKTQLSNLKTLLAGVQAFYQDKSARSIIVSVPFVALTNTDVEEWQNIAEATQNEVPGYPKDRYGLFYRGVDELKANGWGIITNNSSARIGGFPSLGKDFGAAPSGYGAAALGSYFIEPPNVIVATCSPSQSNPTNYEGAFYATGHELGHTLGLRHTNSYDVTLPSDWHRSMMYNGQGTLSKLFWFEIERLRRFLDSWR